MANLLSSHFRRSLQFGAANAIKWFNKSNQCKRGFNSEIIDLNQLKRYKSTCTVNFKFANGNIKTIEAKLGTNLLDAVLDHDVDIDGFGACEGTLACSTCHLIMENAVYDAIPPPVDEELDMLDLAFDLTDTSRLGCQVVLTKDLDGITVQVPATVEDVRG